MSEVNDTKKAAATRLEEATKAWNTAVATLVACESRLKRLEVQASRNVKFAKGEIEAARDAVEDAKLRYEDAEFKLDLVKVEMEIYVY